MSEQKDDFKNPKGAQKPAVREPQQPIPKEANLSGTSGAARSGKPSSGQGAAGVPSQQIAQGEFGEGNYKATRDYNEGLKEHMATHDIEREARDAAPKDQREAEDMERAEDEGRAGHPSRDGGRDA